MTLQNRLILNFFLRHERGTTQVFRQAFLFSVKGGCGWLCSWKGTLAQCRPFGLVSGLFLLLYPAKFGASLIYYFFPFININLWIQVKATIVYFFWNRMAIRSCKAIREWYSSPLFISDCISHHNDMYFVISYLAQATLHGKTQGFVPKLFPKTKLI